MKAEMQNDSANAGARSCRVKPSDCMGCSQCCRAAAISELNE